jgi:hypothetical protein
VLSKQNQNTKPVMAVRPAVVSADPNSRALELKFSIKIEPSKHRRTVPFKCSASKHLWIQAAVTVPHGNVQFAGLAA